MGSGIDSGRTLKGIVMEDVSEIRRGYMAGWWMGWSEKMARVMLDRYVARQPCPLPDGPCRCAQQSPDPDAHWN